jgi:hypothetical protein
VVNNTLGFKLPVREHFNESGAGGVYIISPCSEMCLPFSSHERLRLDPVREGWWLSYTPETLVIKKENTWFCPRSGINTKDNLPTAK